MVYYECDEMQSHEQNDIFLVFHTVDGMISRRSRPYQPSFQGQNRFDSAPFVLFGIFENLKDVDEKGEFDE